MSLLTASGNWFIHLEKKIPPIAFVSGNLK
jgi:hypothetical protein